MARMIIIKKLDFINSGDQASSHTFENVIFRMDQIQCNEYISSLVFVNCVFEQGLKVEGLSSSDYIHFDNCEFLHQTGLYILDCKLHSLCIWDCVLSGNSDNYFKLFTGILPETLLIKNSNIETVSIINSKFNFEAQNSLFRKKFKYYAVDQKNTLNADQQEKEFPELYLYFGSTIFSRAKIDIRVPRIESITFEQLDDKNCQKKQLEIHDKGMVSIKSDRIKNFYVQNVSFTNSYIDLENVPIHVFEAKFSRLGNHLNMAIARLYDENDRKIISLEIIQSTIVESKFSGREFDNRLNFTKTFFHLPPIFYETKIPEGSVFPNRRYFDFIYDENKLVDSLNAFRYLRKAMEDRRDRDAEGQFYLLEQETKKRLDKIEGTNSFFRMLYGFLSDYGTDYVKPLLVLFSSTIIFTIYYAILLSPILSWSLPFDWDLIGRSLHFSVKQVVLPFWSIKDLTPLFGKDIQTSGVLFLSFVQSLISGISITLAILALRWKFKRG